jgi:uncharacterized membrane protein (DUF4010 family)
MVVVIGSKKMAKYLLPVFGISIAVGVLVILLWPEGWSF